jgi:hypothetical protein
VLRRRRIIWALHGRIVIASPLVCEIPFANEDAVLLLVNRIIIASQVAFTVRAP